MNFNSIMHIDAVMFYFKTISIVFNLIFATVTVKIISIQSILSVYKNTECITSPIFSIFTGLFNIFPFFLKQQNKTTEITS